MLYHSTRNKNGAVDASQAILSGLAPDGGLYMMDRIPSLDLTAMMQQDVYGMAETIL